MRNGLMLVLSRVAATFRKRYSGLNLRIVRGYTFAETKVDKIMLPEGVKTIGQNAFYDYFNLKTISLPNTTTTVERSVFSSCTKPYELAGSDKQDSVTKYLKSIFSLMKLCCFTDLLRR